MDPLEKLKPGRDSSLFWMAVLRQVGHPVWWIHETFEHGVLLGDVQVTYSVYDFQTPPEVVFDTPRMVGWANLKESVIIFRLDPPVDDSYRRVASLWGAMGNVGHGLNIINDPLLIASVSEKHLPYAVGMGIPGVSKGLAQPGEVIKPLWGFGGSGVRLAQFPSLIGSGEMAQQFDPLIATHGEDRYFLIGSRVFGVLAKRPRSGDFRTNTAHGSFLFWEDKPAAQQRSQALAAGSFFSKKGITLATLDFIGDRLVEVNVTCPGLMYPSFVLSGRDDLLGALAKVVSKAD